MWAFTNKPWSHQRPAPPSVSSRVGRWCAFSSAPPPPSPIFPSVFIYPLIQRINQGQHTMLHMVIKIHCNANSPVASALHWQVLTRRATLKQPHMSTHACIDTHIYQSTHSVNSLSKAVGPNWEARVSLYCNSILPLFPSLTPFIVHISNISHPLLDWKVTWLLIWTII